MAMRAEEITVGVDVCKDWLDVAEAETQPVCRLANQEVTIRQWLQGMAGSVRIAVEPTGDYHRVLAQLAHAAGHQVYLVDALRLCRYREAIGQRAKTDASDARLLRRYLMQEGAHLRAWQPPAAGAERIWRLLKRRATVVRAEVQLRQSLQMMAELQSAAAPLRLQLRALIRRIDQQLLEQARALGWGEQVRRLRAVPGIGPLSAIGLAVAYHRGIFARADHFVAFLGLDVRVRDSGQYRGRRRLSKKGEPELRRLLHVAAMAACRTSYWRAYYQGLRQRGLASIAALVALSRKIVRLAYALLRDQSEFDMTRRAP